MPAPYLQAANKEAPKEKPQICLFAQTNFRNQMRRFGIKLDDRRRHMYIIGKTGMGKSTMMENMMLSDIYNGHGVGLVDPHGDFAEKIINFIPSWRMNDVVYFNPADMEFPIGFNILEVKSEEQKHLVAAGMMGTFKKIWPDVWSARMEYILNNTLLALLDNPGTTLLGINRMMSDKKYRKKIVAKVQDPVVKAFWQVEFASYSERYAQEATSSVQNKIGQFLSTALIRNMVAQPKSTIDIRKLMDDKKILIMNLSKGRMGEDNSRLMGGMLITKLQLSAMERVDQPEHERKDFFLYVDEFQNFATPSFANILSEARKYRLSLIMAHQYIAQLDEVVADAVFGNVGTITTFRVGASDAEHLAKEFAPNFVEEDIVNLSKFRILLKLMIDGVASQPFSAGTMPPIGSPTGSAEKVIRVSRERYGKRREDIEDKVMRWSGLAPQEIGEDEEKKDSSGSPKKSENKKDGKRGDQKKKESGRKDGKSSAERNQKSRNDASQKPQKKREEKQSVAEKKPKKQEPASQADPKPASQPQVIPSAAPAASTEKTLAVQEEKTVVPVIPPIQLAETPPAKVQEAKEVAEPKLELKESESGEAVVSLGLSTASSEPAKEKASEVKKEERVSAKKEEAEHGTGKEEPKKKKRRRRRRKRKKKSATAEGSGSTPDGGNTTPVFAEKPQGANTSAQSRQSLSPNAVVRFDD